MPGPTLDLFGDPLRLPTRRERQRVAPLRKAAPTALPRRLAEPAPILPAPPAAAPLAPPSALAAAAPCPPCADSRLPAGLLSLHPQLWPGHALGRAPQPGLPSGFALLDAELPGRGWPPRAITELQVEGDLLWRLLAPALAPRCRAGQRLLLIGPPHAPHPPGLAAWGIPAAACLWVDARTPHERQWALEQALRADADELAAVLAWLPAAPPRALRRAQVLAARCRAPVFVLLPLQAQAAPSAAPLRLRVRASRHWSYLQVEILKRRGPLPDTPLWLPAPPPSLAAVLPVAVPAPVAPSQRQRLPTP